MKKLNIKWVAAFAFILMLSSCLKNNEYYTDFKSGGASVQLPLAARNRNGLVAFSFDASNTIKLPVYVNVASPETPTTSTTIKLGLDAAFLTQYNTANGSHFEVLPDSTYTTDGWDRTVQAGQRMDSMIVTINPAKLNLTHQYVLPVTIVDASLPIEQWKHLLLYISVKNKYDGVYSVLSGTVTRYTSPGVPAGDALSGSVGGNPDVVLSTAGPSTVEIGNLKWAGGTSGVAGIDNLRLTVDPSTNLVTMFSLGNATLTNWAGHENKYDPATKTFYLAFRWNPTGAVREYDMVIKYKGPR